MDTFQGIEPIYVICGALVVILLLVFLIPKKKTKSTLKTAYESSVMLNSKLYNSLEDLVLKKTQHLYVGNRLVAKTRILVEIVNLLKRRFTSAEQLRSLLQFDVEKSVDIEARFEALMYAMGVYLNKIRKVSTVDNSVLEESPFSYWVRTKLDFTQNSDMGTVISLEMFERTWNNSGLKFSYSDLLNILALCLFGTVYGCYPIECLIDQPGVHIKLSLGGQGQYLRRDVYEDVPLDMPVWVMSKGKFYHLQFIKFSSAKEMGEVVKRLNEAGKSDFDVSDWLSASRLSSVGDEDDASSVFSDLLSVSKDKIDTTSVTEAEALDINSETQGLTGAERKEIIKEKREIRLSREAEENKYANVSDDALDAFARKAENISAVSTVNLENKAIVNELTNKVVTSKNDSVVVVPSADLDLNTLTMFGIVGNSTGVDTVGMVTAIIDASEKRTTRRRNRRRIDLEEET